MKISILGDQKDSFIKPIAEGLGRMSRDCGAEADILHDAHEVLSLPLDINGLRPRAIARHLLKGGRYRKRFVELVERVADARVIVVVSHVPSSLSRSLFGNIEALRDALPHIPIVNYDLVYLPVVDRWSDAILRGKADAVSKDEQLLINPSPFGLERYDWYLTVSGAGEVALPSGPQPLSIIGANLLDGSLYPEQNGEFRVLLDFAQSRGQYAAYRSVQLKALEIAGLPYEVLEGSFPIETIRSRYRSTGAFMLAHRESFGLPICELQACGSLILLPRPEWAPAHWIKPDPHVDGPGTHSANFVIYENDYVLLAERFLEIKENFSPSTVVRTIQDLQPHLIRGDNEALSRFFDLVQDGRIHSALHYHHGSIGKHSR